LGANESALSAGLPARASPKAKGKGKYEVEKIVEKRRINMKVGYLVVWKG